MKQTQIIICLFIFAMGIAPCFAKSKAASVATLSHRQTFTWKSSEAEAFRECEIYLAQFPTQQVKNYKWQTESPADYNCYVVTEFSGLMCSRNYKDPFLSGPRYQAKLIYKKYRTVKYIGDCFSDYYN